MLPPAPPTWLDLGPRLVTSGFYSLQLLSHKFVRHLSPLLLVGLLAGSAVAASEPGALVMQLLFGAQAAFYGLAIGGHLLKSGKAGRWMPLAAPYHFTLIQLAALAGVLSLVCGHRLVAWTPRGGLKSPASSARSVVGVRPPGDHSTRRR